MNLCIDQGNSRTKVALMTDEGKMINHFIYKQFGSSDVERLFDLYDITDSIISSVVNIEAAVVNTLARRSQHFVLFDHNTPVPIVNRYETPQTLGQDRLAAAVGAKSLCLDENLLIIDAGLKMIKKMPKTRVTMAIMIAATLLIMLTNLFSWGISSISLMVVAGLVGLIAFKGKEAEAK